MVSMARNEEKAQALLNRFVSAKRDANRADKSQRPYLASECDDLSDAELYRRQILKGISKKVSTIQNPGLDEHRVRDLNDSINKLVREKGHWERQIKALGGPDYFRTAPQLFSEEEAAEVVPGKGYRYYGAAKQLPGVKELLKKPAPERARRTRFELQKNIDADYYGYRDDDDGVLAELEAKAKPQLMQQAIDQWQQQKAQRIANDADMPDEDLGEADGRREDAEVHFTAHVAVPDQAVIKQAVLKRRKMEVLEKLLGGGAVVVAPSAMKPDEAATLVPPSW